MSKFCIILTTTNNKEIVDLIATTIIESGLVKCLQVDNTVSFFKWEDKLLTENEFRIMIKAQSENYQLIEQSILKLHNYKLPQIVKVDITGGLADYLQWLTTK